MGRLIAHCGRKLAHSLTNRLAAALVVLSSVGLVIGASETLAVGVVTVQGNLPRDLAAGFFDISVTVTNVAKAEVDDTTVDLKSRLKIVLSDQSTTELKTDDSGLDEALPFFMELREAEVQQTPKASQKVDLTWLLRIRQGAGFPNALKELVDKSDTKNKTRVLARYTYKDTKSESSPTELRIKNAVANEAPTGLSVVGTEQALIMAWESKSQIAFIGQDTANDTPGEAVAIIIRRDATIPRLPAKTFNQTATSDVASEGCVYNAGHGNGEECISCPSSLDYLDIEALEDVAPGNVFALSTPRSNLDLSGLENEVEYSVFMMYKPDGIKRSACLVAAPSPNFTLTELNGEGKAKAGSFKCLVATAAFGSPLHPGLVQLRWFRDNFLMHTAFGREVVEQYYRYSPALATFIEEHPWAATVTRGLLWAPIELIRWYASWSKA